MASTTATTNTLNPSVTSSSSIDVASIVSGLMSIANQPLTNLQNKVAQDQAIISDMGTLKSKMSSFQSDLTAFESPSSYSTAIATSTNTNAISASVTNASSAAMGTYNVSVSQVAQSSSIAVTGFADTTTANITTAPLTISIGGTIYSSDGTQPPSNNGKVPVLTSPANLTQINQWLNTVSTNYGLGVNSNIIQTSTGQYALVVNGTSTGTTHAVSIGGLNGGGITDPASPPTTTSGGLTFSLNKSAQDAIFTVNNLQVDRASNTVSDVIPGVTFSVLSSATGANTSTVTVGQGTDNSSTMINNLITSYNAVIGQYQSMTAISSSTNSTSPNGTFANDPGMLSFINDMKNYIAQGVLTADNKIVSLSTMGIDLQTDGTMKFNATNFATAQSNGLLATLNAGVKIGGSVSNTASLSNEVTTILAPTTGFIDTTVTSENTSISNIQTQETSLQAQLAALQASYTQQYSTLNTLLYTLSQTSSQLTSSLGALTNINSGK